MLRGTPVTSGIAIGAAVLRNVGLDAMPVRKITEAEVEAEILRFHTALERTGVQIRALREELTREGTLDPAEIRIFEGHAACLHDPVFRSDIEKGIRDEKLNLEGALQRVIANFQRIFELIENSHLKERVSDVREVASRILDNLDIELDAPDPPPTEAGGILVTEELRMADLVGSNERKFVGIVAERGTRTSHASLMARSLRIPMVVGVEGITRTIKDGAFLLVDGTIGTVYPDPPESIREEYQSLQRDLDRSSDRYSGLIEDPCTTLDGTPIQLYASAANASDLAIVRSFGMDGVGLYRSDTAFLERADLPTEDELTAAYRDVSQAAGEGPAVIRLVNLGSARGVAGRQIERETNPSLGRRALRLLFHNEDIFRTQVRAIIRANESGNMRILLPFVSDIDDIRRARTFIDDCARALVAEGVSPDQCPRVGCCVEVPGLVPMLRTVSTHVDFLTIGLDNLCQFTMAADRVNSTVAEYLDMCQPGFLQQLAMIVQNSGDLPVQAYGEMVRDHRYTYLLLGLGLTRFCLPPYSVPRIKSIVIQTNRDEAAEFACEVLALETKAAVRKALETKTAELIESAQHA